MGDINKKLVNAKQWLQFINDDFDALEVNLSWCDGSWECYRRPGLTVKQVRCDESIDELIEDMAMLKSHLERIRKEVIPLCEK